ncbi:MAG: lysophospholipid acyltransferase family protein [Candidatus Omnitrophota bacterium]
MDGNNRIKILKRTIARYGLFASSWIINRLSFRAMRGITNFFIRVGFRFTVRQKKIARESLHIAFGGQKSEAEINSIFAGCFERVGKGMIELIYFMGHPDLIKGQIVFEGKQYLDDALKAGHGVIAVSAHFGNFPLMLIAFAQQNYKTNAIIRPTRDQEVEKYFLELRKKMGLNTVYSHPRKECVDASIKALRNNELLFIPLDQHFGSGGGVYVDFFGRKAATATGPAVFAMRTQAALIPMFIVRQKDDTHKVIIEPPIAFQECADDQATILANTAKITQVIERYIRMYPEEWGWMHRRWKNEQSLK